jgi:hypothetical protein
MNVLIVDTWLLTPHLETGLEIALNHKARGDSVTYVNLWPMLEHADDGGWLSSTYFSCTGKLARARAILSEYGIAIIQPSIEKSTLGDIATFAKYADIRSKEQLLKLHYEIYQDLGFGVLSSLLSFTRNPYPNFNQQAKLIRKIIRTALVAYRATSGLLAAQECDLIYTFNGRFAASRGVIRAAESRGVAWRTHERGCDMHHYRVDDQSIHDFQYTQKLICDFWQAKTADPGTAHSFFSRRRNREEHDWYSFTKGQEKNRIPENLRKSRYVAFFTTSEDEFSAILECMGERPFPSQLEAVRLAAHVCLELGARLVVRVHPHLNKKHINEYHAWKRLEIPNTDIILPESPVDTYTLIDNADAVITFGSTVGVEATYWGRPSILMAPSFYDNLNVATFVSSQESLASAITARTIFPIDGALMYGYFFTNFGVPFCYFEPTSFYTGRISGKDLSLANFRTPIKTALDRARGLWRWMRRLA